MDIFILKHLKINELEYLPTTISGYITRTKIRLDHFKRRNYWMMDKLEGFNKGDYVNLEYCVVYYNEYPHHWIYSIQKSNIIAESQTKTNDCKCIIF